MSLDEIDRTDVVVDAATSREASPPRPWWRASVVVAVVLLALLALALQVGPAGRDLPASWVVAAALHAPFVVVLCFLIGGLIERVGYFWRGRAPVAPGRLPYVWPTVCVQLPMFNEHAVARRVIEAASAMRWPRDRFSVQVLDDSTDPATRRLVAAVCAEVRRDGVDCTVLHRADRTGYKAGALEAGRRQTDAELLVIFDADFVPPADFLVRTVPHFYDADGRADDGLALVQAQWGHLNHDESALTRAQSLWVDDHHTLQMAWRSAQWQFVNFTGTAGVWRAASIEATGGWRASSLVEDCELSFRHLFAGYRTTFVKEIVVPAELPATPAAYRSQQRRWTRGWVQLQRLHLATLLFRFRCSWPRRLHLVYHMCIGWQWPAWAVWAATLPVLIHTGLWAGAVSTELAVALYVGPPAVWALLAATAASVETRHTYPAAAQTPRVLLQRVGRVVPYVVLNAGMLPHQFSSFAEGLFGGMHGEFERTPKAATVTGSAGGAVAASPAAAASRPRRNWPYVLTEAFYVGYQLTWAAVFVVRGLLPCAAGAAYMAGAVVLVARFSGRNR